jgi:hypothetical protein
MISVKKIIHSFFLFLIAGGTSLAQQVPDSGFDPVIAHPAYPAGQGPVVLIDQAHHNSNTVNAFSKVLTKDGYNVKLNTKPFTEAGLKDAKILVIANAIHLKDTAASKRKLPTTPAFTPAEVLAVKIWVSKGGSLFFIADHMPFPGASQKLASVFGITFYNGFVIDTTAGPYPGDKKEPDIFKKKSGTLADHEVTRGSKAGEGVDSIATFTGQAFRLPAYATSIFTFNSKYEVLLPDTAGKFHPNTRKMSAKGLSGGALLDFDKGRVAVFGEAAMFNAQRRGKDIVPFGLNSNDAPQNLQFMLNVFSWLDNKKK